MVTGFWGYISAIVAVGITIVILGMALAVLWSLFNGTISLKYLLAEPASPIPQENAQAAGLVAPPAQSGGDPGVATAQPPEVSKASLSRFQFMIFTFVIAGVYLILCLETGTFVEIPNNVVLLLGVSGGTYAASKGIKAASDSQSTAG